MKKLLSILLISAMVYTAANAEDLEIKKRFYDNIQNSMMASLEGSLIQQGYPASKAKAYRNALNARINRQEMENATWACVSKYQTQMVDKKDQIAHECFSSWVSELIMNNNDLSEMLVK